MLIYVLFSAIIKKIMFKQTFVGGKTDLELQNELSGISRREKLCRIIREKGQITARQAAELFGVSDMTVRRDFHLLEQQGIVSLFHGGARIRPYGGGFQGYFDRKEKLYPVKKAIASAAAEFISENDVVYFDTSETVTLMLRFVSEISFTAVTGSVPIINECLANRRIKLYIAPGLYRERYGGSLDYSTAEYLSALKFDKSFFGASAIDPVFGVSSGEESESAVKKCVMRNSEKKYLLADGSKFMKKNMIKYGNLSDFTEIFSDSGLDGEIRKAVEKNKGSLRICY